MTARQRAEKRWADPEAVPELPEVLAERGPPMSQAELERLVARACAAHDIPEGPSLRWRIEALCTLGLQRQAEARAAQRRAAAPPLSDVAVDLLDSLRGCKLTAKQIAEDTGRLPATVYNALERLRGYRYVTREHRGGVWIYQITAFGRKALQRCS
jgi:hypothetical protein